MAHIKILDASEQEVFDSPPVLTGIDRKRFLDLSVGVKKIVDSLRTPTNKVCFLVALGYFKASNRFTARQFYDADVAYVAKKLDIPLKNIEVSEYDKESYQRHKRLILDFLGFQEFDAQARKSIAIEISTMVRSQKRPKLILVNVLEILIHQKIAIPPYNTLYTLIINQLQEHKQELILVIENQLPKSLQKLLDELLEQGENKSQNLQRYKLTLLKRFSQSTRPSKIKNTVSDVSTLGSLYSKLESTVEALNLSHEGLRYYAQIVIKTKIFQLIRKSSEDRYLHLIAFVAHQFFKGQDILLSVTQNAINIAQRERKEKYFQDRLERKRSVKRLLGTVEKGITNPLEKIESIAFTKDCPDEEKVKLIQKIFLETKDNRGIANEEIDQFEQATKGTVHIDAKIYAKDFFLSQTVVFERVASPPKPRLSSLSKSNCKTSMKSNTFLKEIYLLSRVVFGHLVRPAISV